MNINLEQCFKDMSKLYAIAHAETKVLVIMVEPLAKLGHPELAEKIMDHCDVTIPELAQIKARMDKGYKND